MRDIFLLSDYKNRFGSSYNAKIYKGGMDHVKIQKYFNDSGFNAIFLNASKVDFKQNHKNKLFLYTSSEDPDYLYKSFIEDIVLGLEVSGAIMIPSYKYLRANNNKVFMEILRDNQIIKSFSSIKSLYFGSYEDFLKNFPKTNDTLVIKSSAGAGGTGVSKASGFTKIKSSSKKISSSKNFLKDLKDYLRTFKHKNYVPRSKNRKKFIVQNFINGLDNDWKILIYGEYYYVMYRPNKKNDFRASGSGHDNYIYGDKTPIPSGLLTFAKSIYECFNVPNISLDIAYNGEDFFLIEFQALYFGSVCQVRANAYHQLINTDWTIVKEKLSLERVYVESVKYFINKNSL
jgi:glutathione synthase/RimK-type ligase-like ATP-grasp enzyme